MKIAPKRSTAATSKKSTASSASKPSRTPVRARAHDAIAILKADHKEVSALFDSYAIARQANTKKKIASQICTMLLVHAQIEEEIFYPAFQLALKDKTLVAEAKVEHASLKALIGQIEDTEPDGEMFDAKVKVLSEYVTHHVKEEQDEMFPLARSSSLDLVALGVLLAERKQVLLDERAPMKTMAERLGSALGAALRPVVTLS